MDDVASARDAWRQLAQPPHSDSVSEGDEDEPDTTPTGRHDHYVAPRAGDRQPPCQGLLELTGWIREGPREGLKVKLV